MNAIAWPLLIVSAIPAELPKPIFPLGKETTYVTGPLDKEGYVDYEAALNERLSKGIDPKKNANALLWQAIGREAANSDRLSDSYFKELGIERPKAEGTYFVDLFEYLKKRVQLDSDSIQEVFKQESDAHRTVWSAKEYPHLASWLKENERPLSVATEAARLPQFYNPIMSRSPARGPAGLLAASFGSTSHSRTIAGALCRRAMLRTSEKQYAEAWQDLLACHRIGRHMASGASVIESLAGIAIDQVATQADIVFLQAAEPDAAACRNYLRDLSSLPPIPGLADRINLHERFVYLDLLQMIRREGIDFLRGFDGIGRKASPAQIKALEGIDWAPALRDTNRLFDDTVAALSAKTRAERLAKLTPISDWYDAAAKKAVEVDELEKLLEAGMTKDELVREMICNLIAKTLPQGHRKVQDGHDRTEQSQRNLKIAFALAAYRANNTGYPEKLSDLTPKYLDAIPDDIFSGKSLIYRVEKDGYLLYSIGINGKDEGGRWFDDDPPGDDLRVRMPVKMGKK